VKRLLVLALVAGCATFEDPTIVLDLRVIAMETEPPEQVLDVPMERLPSIQEILDQLKPIRVRAHIAEPGRPGPLAWTMSACILDEGLRCEDPATAIDFAGGILADPENNSVGDPCKDTFEPGGTVCGQLVPDNRFVQMLFKALEADPTRGLGGIDIGFQLRVFGIDVEPFAEVFAAKHVRFAARVPFDRKPNNNPHIDQLLLGRGATGANVQKQHCRDTGGVDVVEAGERVTLYPVSREGDNEMYVLPTLDGGSERFVEYLSYQWIATAGSFSDEMTGGPPDVFGNIRLDGTEWKAPDFENEGFVTIWALQRDARYGLRWREACIKVVPP
jgi:hypothetical protein